MTRPWTGRTFNHQGVFPLSPTYSYLPRRIAIAASEAYDVDDGGTKQMHWGHECVTYGYSRSSRSV